MFVDLVLIVATGCIVLIAMGLVAVVAGVEGVDY